MQGSSSTTRNCPNLFPHGALIRLRAGAYCYEAACLNDVPPSLSDVPPSLSDLLQYYLYHVRAQAKRGPRAHCTMHAWPLRWSGRRGSC